MCDPTPEDLAAASMVCADIREQVDDASQIIARAIAKARAEERERCAKVADANRKTPTEHDAMYIAAQIRGLK